MTASRQNVYEVRVPASTANLGAGFDCLGLALELYLSVRATVLSAPGSRTSARSRGVRGTSLLPKSPDQNLILRAMRSHRRARRARVCPIVRLAVQNQIPVAGGLGSSAAATVAGVALGFAVNGHPIPTETRLAVRRRNGRPCRQCRRGASRRFRRDFYARRRHRRRRSKALAENGSPGPRDANRRPWKQRNRGPFCLKPNVSRADAVHNLQRTALFVAAVEERRFDLLWDAMQDRLHQSDRQTLIPGLADILARCPACPACLALRSAERVPV